MKRRDAITELLKDENYLEIGPISGDSFYRPPKYRTRELLFRLIDHLGLNLLIIEKHIQIVKKKNGKL